jgi:hypothetical protein
MQFFSDGSSRWADAADRYVINCFYDLERKDFLSLDLSGNRSWKYKSWFLSFVLGHFV